ncbi:MAG: winged helix-turn-helix transcriptional regulator, partial [Candidatus Kariarchaeaceae archaeon]
MSVIPKDKLDTEEKDCPLSRASLLLSSKWDLIVIHNIENGVMRFSELKEKISLGIEKSVTASSLSRILKRLEINNLIKRNVKSQIGESIEISYELTEQGRDLKPVIIKLQEWGKKY